MDQLARNKEVALRFVEAMGENDPEGAGECLAPDVRVVAKGTTAFAGTRSREMVLGGIAAFKKLMPTGLKFAITTVTAEDDRVVIEAVGNAVTADGAAYRNEYCKVFTFAEGKIVQLNEYFCTKMADDVLLPVARKAQALEDKLQR